MNLPTRQFFHTSRRAISFATALSSLAVAGATTPQAWDDRTDALRTALCFHASFDHGPAADFARGDRALYHAPSLDRRQETTAGLPSTGEVVLADTPGRPGQALHFRMTKAPLMLFKAEKNFPSPQVDWSGTVSFWLSVDPVVDLAPGFCDPIQLTSKKWDDAAMFVEFEKLPTGIPFRLGVYADTPVWNPQGRKWEEIPAAEKPLVTVEKPPFAKDSWVHVAFTIDHFNTGRPDGIARLYLNGKEAGQISPRSQTFTWDSGKAILMLGVGYAGLMDNLALFNRSLTPVEIAHLHTLWTRLHTLHPNP